MPGGRPLRYKTPEELEEAINEYFDVCEQVGAHPTMSGMSLALGFVDRHALAEYGHREEFSATIKKARARIEAYLEGRLYGQAVTGVIFNLKNNFGWTDKQVLSGDKDSPLTVEIVRFGNNTDS